MRIKGTALLARRNSIERAFGVEAWSSLVREMRPAHPFFAELLTAASLVPLDAFLSIHDEIVRRFYHGVTRIYLTRGEQSADWALSQGPYRSFLMRKDMASFVESFPTLWGTYFVETTSERPRASLRDGVSDSRGAGLAAMASVLRVPGGRLHEEGAGSFWERR